MSYQYQIFISYKSHDEAWAEQFYKRFTKDEIKCFWDKESILPGTKWEDEILKAIQNSQHMLVLMSQEAKKDLDWVNKEYMRFDALINSPSQSQVVENRKIFFVLLDDDDRSFNRFQKVTDLLEAKVYPTQQPADVAQTAVWERVITQIKKAALADPNTIPVTLAVMALTRDRFDQLYNIDFDDFAKNVNDLLLRLGINWTDSAVLDKFKQSYGQQPTDWKPFAGTLSAVEILESVAVKINRQIDQQAEKGQHFGWDLIGKRFYSVNTRDVSDELAKINTRYSVFVVDPISLFDSRLVNKLDLLEEYFKKDQAAVLMLPPIVPSQQVELLSAISQAATNFYNRFYDSSVLRRYPPCDWHICNDLDIGRFLRTALGPRVYPPPAAVSHAALSQGEVGR